MLQDYFVHIMRGAISYVLSQKEYNECDRRELLKVKNIFFDLCTFLFFSYPSEWGMFFLFELSPSEKHQK